MTEIWILTHSFPYEPGEQFLETEIKYWSKLSHDNIVLLPASANGIKRNIPPNITVDPCFTKIKYGTKLCALAEAVFSLLFFRELRWLKQNRLFSLSNITNALRIVSSVIYWYNSLYRKRMSSKKKHIIIYSYWFNTLAYAAALLRREGLIDFLVTRAHRFDVYEECQKNKYMPLKRQFVKDFDMVFPISDEGSKYLQIRYAIPVSSLKRGRLGVTTRKNMSLPSANCNFNILSVSYCVPVKRIERIIDALELVAPKFGKKVFVNWTHIGNGKLREVLKIQASIAFKRYDNISYNFLGQLSNSEVLRYLETQNIDVFINTSESEGVPVSIMEAMSFGIPVIAPDVGGISEIVNMNNGWLLSKEPSVKEIADAIYAYDHYKSIFVRKTARDKILVDFNADINYPTFVKAILLGNQFNK
jgi:colanic acid/amylovoran biosynthesis glycosyltransferase